METIYAEQLAFEMEGIAWDTGDDELEEMRDLIVAQAAAEHFEIEGSVFAALEQVREIKAEQHDQEIMEGMVDYVYDALRDRRLERG